MAVRFFMHSKGFCCVTSIYTSTCSKCFIFIMIYCSKSLYFRWHTCITKSSSFIQIVMPPKEFLVPFLDWTKGSARFSQNGFWKVYIFKLIFLWDSIKRNIRIFWNFLCAHDCFHLECYQGDCSWMFLQVG